MVDVETDDSEEDILFRVGCDEEYKVLLLNTFFSFLKITYIITLKNHL